MTNRSRWLAGLVALALAVRVVFLAVDPNPWDSAGLSAGQGEMARNIVDNGRWFVAVTNAPEISERQAREQRLVDPSDIDYGAIEAKARYAPVVLEMPGSAVILAALWALSGDKDYVYIQVLQVLLDAAMVALVFWIALRLYGRQRAALLGAAAYAVFLPMVTLAKVPHLDIWGAHATLAIFALLIKAREADSSLRWLAAAGVVTGLGLYFRPSLLVLPAGLALFLIPLEGWRRALRFGVTPTLIALVLLAPWAIRNYVVFDRFIPTRSGAGQTMWEGLGEIPNNFGAILSDSATLAQVQRERPGLHYGTPEYDDYLAGKAKTAIAEQPGHYAKVVARRVADATILLRNPWLGHGEQSPGAYTASTGRGFASFVLERPWDTFRGGLATLAEPLLFLAAILTAALTRRQWWRKHLFLLGVPAATIAPYLVLHVEPRYILPGSFAYIILFGLGADLVVGRLGARRRALTRAAPAGAAE